MKKKYASPKLKQRAYMERKKVGQEEAAEMADATATMKRMNLCGFSEVAFDTPARTWLEEVQVHRSWLRALQHPDILPGETLRQLSKRTWQALLNSKGFGVDTDGGEKWVDTEDGKQWVEGFDVSYPLFDPQKQHFQVPFDSTRFPDGPFIEGIRDAAKPGWFETHWVAPKGCTGDEPIDTASLPKLPPIQSRKRPELKPEPRVPPTVDAPLGHS